jgi:perosamine synthetase
VVANREGSVVTATHPVTSADFIPVMRPALGTEEAAAAAEAVLSGWVAQGPRVTAFEEAMAARVLAHHAVAVSSCTVALHLCLVVLGISPGDEVVVPSLSFIATANVVRYVGATPVFAEVEPATQNLTPATIDAVRTAATRAVILVHQAGVPADITRIHELCEPLGIAVVEDAACAVGARYRGRPVGGHSDLVTFSFHPRKVITTGEGGMVLTRRADWAERLRRLRTHGMSVSAETRHQRRDLIIEDYLETGYNYRMTDIQAAVGLVQLGRLDAIVTRRRELARRYRERLAGVPGLTIAGDPPWGETNYQGFWITLPDDFPVTRNDLMRTMLARGISPRRGVMAAHLEPAYRGQVRAPLPVTERLTRQSLILPLFHDMTEEQQDRVVSVVIESAGLRRGR